MNMPRPAPGDVARLPMRPYWVSLGLIALFTAWPAILVYIAAVIADLNGCLILEAGPSSCFVLGIDLGGALYQLGMLGEMFGVTFPVGSLLAFFWFGALVVNAMAWRRKHGARGRDIAPAGATGVQVELVWYGVGLVPIVAVLLATLAGWLPAPVLFLVIFVAIFWLFSFVFAVIAKIGDLRGRKQ